MAVLGGEQPLAVNDRREMRAGDGGGRAPSHGRHRQPQRRGDARRSV